MGEYAFGRAAWDREDERLAMVERQLDPVSRAAISQLGLRPGWRCWEAGAGRGSMARWLAGRVTASGSVLATDLDVAGLDLGQVTVARHDLELDASPAGPFDLVHARLVLEHLRDPAAAVRKLVSALAPGGWLVLEDAGGLGFAAEPAAGSLAALTGPWERAARQAGWDPGYGRRLVAELRRAGLERVAGWSHRSIQPGGEAWAGARLGLDRLRDQVRQAGAAPAEIEDALSVLADPGRVITGAPIVTAWGQQPG